MSLPAGTRVGPFEIVSLLGAGGMGEVYRARDSVLHRDVAVKIMPRALADDPDRVARFRREAQVLAALNHPNIGHIYGVEDTGTGPALVLELVEGPTLADRIADGPIDTADALRIASQIAHALEAAHSQSIIHRDLKPANVKVRDDGTVKVLDFGLAKAFDATSTPASELANSPTITNQATALGQNHATAGNMAPEQAQGRTVDRRADIWAFGVVLYEMLTGRPLFKGEDVSDTLAAVLKTDPDWRALPADTPPPVLRVLRRCLVRDPKERLRDIADARLELEEALSAPADRAVTSGRLGRRERSLWLAALVATAVATTIVTWRLRPAESVPPETRLHLVTSSTGPFALAPDGRAIAYWAPGAQAMQLSIRRFADEAPRALPGAESSVAGALTWSPDGQSIVYLDGRRIVMEVPVDGGAAHALPIRAGGFGLTLNADGVMLHAPANAAAIARVQVTGGTPEPATRVVAPQVGHRFPAFLPDGRHFLFLATGPEGTQGIYLGTLGSLESRRLVDADTAAVFLAPHFVVFGRQDALFAQRVNLQTLEPEGPPQRVADNVEQQRTVFGLAALAGSASRTLAYRQEIPPTRRLTWFDRAGKPIGAVGSVDSAESDSPVRLSRDGRLISVGRRVGGNTDLWTVANSPQGTLQRLTSDLAVELSGVWSPDARQIAFQSSRKGGGFYDLYVRHIDGSGEETLLIESDNNKTIHDWSRDNGFVLYGVQGREQIARDLWAVSMDGERKAFPVAETPFDEVAGRFSPDTKWIAYQSNAAGTGTDIYVRPFLRPGREWRITSGGGAFPNWRGDGRELYYVAPGNRLMAVSIALPETGDALEVGAPVHLFTSPAITTYAPAADGQRFLLNQIVEDVPAAPITVILNWRGR
jgi:Tol biopolymer transport system component